MGSPHPRPPSSALPRLRPEWRQGQGWKRRTRYEVWGGGSPTSGCVTRVAMATPFTLQGPAGAGRRAGPLQHQGGRGQQRPRLGGASPAAGCAAAAPGPCSEPAPEVGGEPSRSVPVPVLSPDTARQHGPGEPGVPGGTGGYPGGLLRAVAAPGKFGKLGARSPEWGLGEDTASLVGFW